MTTSKNKQKSKTMVAQPISEADLAIILALHQRRLGWSYLLENTIADQTVGFPCETEEFCIRRELKTVVQKISEWFRAMGSQNNWPIIEGWIWEIDFEASRAVPKKLQRLRGNKTETGQKGSECSLPVEGPIMTLGDIELDIIKRLLEKREALADTVRSYLRRYINEEGFNMNELNNTVQQLGAAETNVRDWFSEMADKYKWPRSEDNSLFYRVDIPESQVYLLCRGICSCTN
ncbi:MAG: hypothetical protein ACYTE8_03605 [Planctomycetota bacterium]|jgi:CXXX repeat modification system protein